MKTFFRFVNIYVSDFVTDALRDKELTSTILYTFYGYTSIQLINFMLILLGFTFHYEELNTLDEVIIWANIAIYPVYIISFIFGIALLYFCLFGVWIGIRVLFSDIKNDVINTWNKAKNYKKDSNYNLYD